jgi:hypothetical protein
MRVLTNYGLVEVDKLLLELLESRGYSIHRCIRLWTVHILNQEWNHDFATVAVNTIAFYVPEEQAIRPWLIQ